jgi:NADP-dependent 3-hydroxy acid dehydrogenase YdfG
MNVEIKNKVVVITGASSGIGEAMALLLAENGAKVVLGARRKEQLDELVAQIKNTGGEAAYAVTDVTSRTDVVNLVQLACDQFGRLDVMINNAGISQLSRMDELDVTGWETMIDINLKGVLYGMAAAIPLFQKQQAGHIINIISTSGLKITPTMGVYAATKNAVRTLTEAFRQESDGKIRITGISPGFVKTELAHNIKNPEARNAVQASMDNIALSPMDIANAVAFAIGLPAGVEIGDLTIRPAVQN